MSPAIRRAHADPCLSREAWQSPGLDTTRKEAKATEKYTRVCQRRAFLRGPRLSIKPVLASEKLCLYLEVIIKYARGLIKRPISGLSVWPRLRLRGSGWDPGHVSTWAGCAPGWRASCGIGGRWLKKPDRKAELWGWGPGALVHSSPPWVPCPIRQREEGRGWESGGTP